MNIVHVMIASFFKEGYGYQENIITKKHVELGHNVSIITYDRFGLFKDILKGKDCGDYLNRDGVHVYVLPKNMSSVKKIPILMFCFPYTKGFERLLSSLSPDIIFVHSLQSQESLQVLKYKKRHPSVKLFFDHHADYYNTPVRTIPQKIVNYGIFRYYAFKLQPYTEHFWAVSPWRLDYLRKVYGVKNTKSSILVMGGDEELIDWSNRDIIRRRLRAEYNIPSDAFVVVSGGKINKEKNIHILVQSIAQIDGVYLLLFGKFEDDMKEYIDLFNADRIKNVGWISPDKTYALFHASDLAVFPGTHSVLWEQACASGIPAIFKDWDGGFNHVDVGGNCILLDNISVDTLTETISNIINDKTRYEKMKTVAGSIARKEFSYMEIAKKSISNKY